MDPLCFIYLLGLGCVDYITAEKIVGNFRSLYVEGFRNSEGNRLEYFLKYYSATVWTDRKEALMLRILSSQCFRLLLALKVQLSKITKNPKTFNDTFKRLRSANTIFKDLKTFGTRNTKRSLPYVTKCSVKIVRILLCLELNGDIRSIRIPLGEVNRNTHSFAGFTYPLKHQRNVFIKTSFDRILL